MIKDIEKRLPSVQMHIHTSMCQALEIEAHELIGRRKELCKLIRDAINTTQIFIINLQTDSHKFKDTFIKEYEHRQGELVKMLEDLGYFDA